ncbi:DUF3775 domain-containing protein [Ponticaulis sp.]|uniref:DUF3775 domain-containing protein n=1 Tax=Ponticaulis sp. TaxID=2020902 RepID=UPI000B67E252|nr:DUF3775 domain-containing protein [Ponticaulis sp.]MAI88942.1 hypothetical protein [Ponticaulis sp.]OUY01629.1 MAG: hypothetical protein CBB65_00490 [Hyphomonadaceae bacterium TMED5]|tara:strand:+ start:64571 stop:65020 length:450 start_codon:yes stop_codon:yes gene_type:complete
MKTIDTGPKVDDLGVSEETLAAIILEARAFDVTVPETDEDEASNDIDDDEISALEDQPDNPAEQVLLEAIKSLSIEEQETLVALAWVGRGDYDAAEWGDARKMAADRDNGDVAHYLAGMPTLGDYLENGAEALGISLADTSTQTMSHMG